MPYIDAKSRTYFDEKPFEAKTDGDLAYILYKFVVLPAWKAEPRWTTYATLRKGQLDPRRVGEFLKYAKALEKNGADVVAIMAAYTAAVDELKRKYVDQYEMRKIQENGDIE